MHTLQLLFVALIVSNQLVNALLISKSPFMLTKFNTNSKVNRINPLRDAQTFTRYVESCEAISNNSHIYHDSSILYLALMIC